MKRDIKSLQSNEAIAIPTLKIAKKIAKLFESGYKNTTLKKEGNVVVMEAFNQYGADSAVEVCTARDGSKIVNYASVTFYTDPKQGKQWNRNIVPASDFLPKKKKKVTREWVRQEIAKYLSTAIQEEPAATKNALEVGKWYKSTKHQKVLLYYTGKEYENYGFSPMGEWTTRVRMKEADIYTEATPEEVETALINEAKKRGYKEGTVINGISENDIKALRCVLADKMEYYGNVLHGLTPEEHWDRNNSNPSIFKNGKWAEIVSPPEPEIDWSKGGQLVESGNFIVLTTGYHDHYYFSGVRLDNSKSCNPKKFRCDFSKNVFKPYTGTITLSNK